ncbi:MAG: hypothetical protein ACLRH0_11905 [Blautia wexlerae]
MINQDNQAAEDTSEVRENRMYMVNNRWELKRILKKKWRNKDMADEPLRIKVDKNVYQQTLDSLETQLEAPQSHKRNLQRQLDRLNSGNTARDPDVRSAIEKTEEVLKTVGDSISRVMGYKK